jgi:hypothetical protein
MAEKSRSIRLSALMHKRPRWLIKSQVKWMTWMPPKKGGRSFGKAGSAWQSEA